MCSGKCHGPQASGGGLREYKIFFQFVNGQVIRHNFCNEKQKWAVLISGRNNCQHVVSTRVAVCDRCLSRVSKRAQANNCHVRSSVGINPALCGVSSKIRHSRPELWTTFTIQHYIANNVNYWSASKTAEINASTPRPQNFCLETKTAVSRTR